MGRVGSDMVKEYLRCCRFCIPQGVDGNVSRMKIHVNAELPQIRAKCLFFSWEKQRPNLIFPLLSLHGDALADFCVLLSTWEINLWLFLGILLD